jgi:uncharacterized protein (DUF4415 family)
MRKPAKSKKTYTRSDLRDVSDNPEWTRQDFARAKSFQEVLPDLATSIRRRGPNKAPTKTAVSLRLSKEVLDYYKSTGTGWQTRIDDTLLASVKKKRSSVGR